MPIDLTSISYPVEAEMTQVRRSLSTLALQSDNSLLKQVVEHVMHRQGKMMRPLLLLLVSKLLGEVTDDALHVAASFELLHTGSLIHDDVVDESNMRRGQSSVNSIYDNKVAVLSGDFFMSSSMRELAQANDLRFIQTISILGQRLAEGELLQLQNLQKDNFDYNIYYKIIDNKTASFFAACARCGALAAGASDEMVATMEQFGRFIGMGFQIRDDIFDYYHDECVGKPTGNDMREGKLTLPALYVVNTSGREDLKVIARKVCNLEATSEEIEQLIAASIEYGGIEFAKGKLIEFANKATQILDNNFEPSPVVQALKDYVAYTVRRDI